MEAKIKRFKEIYACFVDRPVDGALIVATDEASTPWLLQAAQEFDERSHEDITWIFAAAWTDAEAWASAMVDRFVQELAGLASQGPRGEGDDAAAAHSALTRPLPAECVDPGRAPIARIEALIREIHRRVAGADRRLIWCLCPTALGDRAGYRALVSALLGMPRPPGLRLVLRDAIGERCLADPALLPEDPSIVSTTLAISQEELRGVAARQAADPQQPPEVRFAALLQLAIVDIGEGRLEEAVRKYRHIAARGPREQPCILALAWFGLGELAERGGDLSGAREHLSQALVVLGETRMPTIQYTVTAALGRVHGALGGWPLAELCFAAAAGFAVALASEEASARALEGLGEARVAQGKIAEARDAWTAAADLWAAHGGHGEDHERALRRRLAALERG